MEPDFNLGIPGARIIWKGYSGMKLTDFERKLSLASTSPPSVLLVHLGTNDLVGTPIQEIQWRLQQCLLSVSKHLPLTRLVWSEILPRLHYKGASSQAKVETARKTLNRRFRTLVGRFGGHIIRHPNFQQNARHLYRKDGIHLSEVGQNVFLQDLKEGLQCFQLYPSIFSYPLFSNP